MLSSLLSLFGRPARPCPSEIIRPAAGLYAVGTPAHRDRPPAVETQLSQMEHSALQFQQWWAVRSESGSLRGPRQPLAAEAYAAGAASVYALAESLGVTLHPPGESQELTAGQPVVNGPARA